MCPHTKFAQTEFISLVRNVLYGKQEDLESLKTDIFLINQRQFSRSITEIMYAVRICARTVKLK